MLSWAQVVEVSRAEARQDVVDILESVGFPATSWQEGSVPYALTEIGAYIWSKSTSISVYLKNSYLNETAVGVALEKFSISHYQNRRRDPVATVRLVTLTCAADEGPYTLEPGDFQAKNASGYVFSNVVDKAGLYPANYPLTVPSGGSVQVLLEAEIPGEASNTEDGGVNRIVTTYAGVTITSDTPWITGVDKESEASLKRRNETKWSLLTKFGLIDETVEALARLASEAVDRVYVNSTNPRGPGTFDLIVTGATGSLSANEKTKVYKQITPYILFDRDTALQVHDAPLAPLNIAGTVYVTSEFEWESTVLPAIQAAIEAWRRTIPLGGFPYPNPGNKVPLNEIETVIRMVKVGDKFPVKTVKLSTPSGDISVAAFAHVTMGTLTLTPAYVL